MDAQQASYLTTEDALLATLLTVLNVAQLEYALVAKGQQPQIPMVLNCPTNTSLLTNTCINCSIQYCSLCSAANVCQTCVNNLQANTAGTACECPSGQTLSNSNCYACSVTNCVVCNATNFCSQCATNFVATSLGACVCQSGYTLSGSTCV